VSKIEKTSTKTVDRFAGTIVGMAVGDAIGAPVEFMNQSTLVAKYGEEGISEMEEAYGLFGAYTDDTQMGIATARGVVRARDKEAKLGSAVDATPFIYDEYLEWLHTQRLQSERRGPGGTCLGSLRSGIAGSVGNPINDSKGCGGVMRVAPVGLVYREREAWRVGNESSALTHGHPGGYLPGGFMAVMIRTILDEGDSRSPQATLHEAYNRGMAYLEQAPKCGKRDHFAALMVQAKDLAAQADRWTDELAMRKLGAGWVGDEALALAVFVAFRYATDFRKAVLVAVNYSGDRDSVGCIVGALVGCLLGVEAIPEDWARNVEKSNELFDLALELRRVARARKAADWMPYQSLGA